MKSSWYNCPANGQNETDRCALTLGGFLEKLRIFGYLSSITTLRIHPVRGQPSTSEILMTVPKIDEAKKMEVLGWPRTGWIRRVVMEDSYPKMRNFSRKPPNFRAQRSVSFWPFAGQLYQLLLIFLAFRRHKICIQLVLISPERDRGTLVFCKPVVEHVPFALLSFLFHQIRSIFHISFTNAVCSWTLEFFFHFLQIFFF